MVRDYLDPSVIQAAPLPAHTYTGHYSSPDCRPGEFVHEEMLSFISTLPETATADIFGLHDNASVSRQRFESLQLLRTWLTVQPAPTATAKDDAKDDATEKATEKATENKENKENQEETSDAKEGGGGATSTEEQVSNSAQEILNTFAAGEYDTYKLRKVFPTLYNDSMNSVLCQELDRFNGLIALIRFSLLSVQRAAAGVEIMSDELELVFNSVFNGQVPEMWKSKSYPTLKSLIDYVNDLKARLNFFDAWIARGEAPSSLWLPGFFFTHAVMTGSLQNYCRQHHHAIDHVEFKHSPFSSAQGKWSRWSFFVWLGCTDSLSFVSFFWFFCCCR